MASLRAVTRSLFVSIIILIGIMRIACGQESAASAASPSSGKGMDAAHDFISKMFAEGTPEYNAAIRNSISGFLDRNQVGIYSNALEKIVSAQVSKVDRDARFFESLRWLLHSGGAVSHFSPFVLVSLPDATQASSNVVLLKGQTEICSGVAVSSTLVLTALHCICDGVDQSVNLGASAQGQMASKRVLLPPLTMTTCPRKDHDPDVALLVTEDLGSTVEVAKLATTSMIDTAAAGRLIGYGFSELGRDESTSWGMRRYADIPILSKSCEGKSSANGQPDPQYYGCTPGIEMVAVSPTGADQCHGDSGAPLFQMSENGSRYVLGIASRPVAGSALHGGCGDGGVYERVDGSVGSWVTAQMARRSTKH